MEVKNKWTMPESQHWVATFTSVSDLTSSGALMLHREFVFLFNVTFHLYILL